MAERTESNADPYLALGVRPFINCCSVRTMHGGSLMLPRVVRRWMRRHISSSTWTN